MGGEGYVSGPGEEKAVLYVVLGMTTNAHRVTLCSPRDLLLMRTIRRCTFAIKVPLAGTHNLLLAHAHYRCTSVPYSSKLSVVSCGCLAVANGAAKLKQSKSRCHLNASSFTLHVSTLTAA